MANLTETGTYEQGIYQLETTDPVVGGPNGVSNKQAEQLGNRTAWLKQHVDTLLLRLKGLGIADIESLQDVLNSKLGATAKAADAHLLDGQDSKVYAPPGAVMTFASGSPPAGWIECNGAALSRTTYGDLFAVISTQYGAGDQSTTFNVPDLRGEFIRGFDNGRGVDAGRAMGSHADWRLPALKLPLKTATQHYSHISFGVSGTQRYLGASSSWNPSYYEKVHACLDSTATGLSSKNVGTEVAVRNIAMLFCIKY